MKRYRLHCVILSPLHVGAGNAIDPLEYVILDGRLHRISFERVVASMDESGRSLFESLIDKGSLVEIRNYIAGKFDPEKDTIFSVETSPQVEALYKAKLNDIRHQLLISPFIRTEGGAVPFIPGSSLKGAVRTALVSEAARPSGLKPPRDTREEYAFEAQVLRSRDAKDDPFRGLKIRDKALLPRDTIVREVKNVSIKRGAAEIPMICELSHSEITAKPVAFETEVLLDDDLFGTGFLSKKFKMEDVITSCNAFYRDKMVMEHAKFFRGRASEKISEQLMNVPLTEGSFLLRLGRFSGVESVTLDKYRNPRPPGRMTVWGTSRNLAEGLYPMGWVKVTVANNSI